MDVGETEIAAGVSVGELLVIESKLVENRGMEIVDVDRVFRDVHSELVAGPVGCAALDSSAGEEH